MKPAIERRRYGPPVVQVLDPEKVRERRISVGVGIQELTDLCALSSTQAYSRFETGGNQGQFSLAFAAAVAQALGVTIGELLNDAQQSADEPCDDPAALGALLAAAERWCHIDHLALASGWTLERTLTALDALDARLAAVGQRLARTGTNEVCIVPALSGDESLPELSSRNITVDGTRIDEAKILYALAGGRVPDRSYIPKMAVRHLRSAGLIVFANGDHNERSLSDLALSDETRFNLCLEPGNTPSGTPT